MPGNDPLSRVGDRVPSIAPLLADDITARSPMPSDLNVATARSTPDGVSFGVGDWGGGGGDPLAWRAGGGGGRGGGWAGGRGPGGGWGGGRGWEMGGPGGPAVRDIMGCVLALLCFVSGRGSVGRPGGGGWMRRGRRGGGGGGRLAAERRRPGLARILDGCGGRCLRACLLAGGRAGQGGPKGWACVREGGACGGGCWGVLEGVGGGGWCLGLAIRLRCRLGRDRGWPRRGGAGVGRSGGCDWGVGFMRGRWSGWVVVGGWWGGGGGLGGEGGGGGVGWPLGLFGVRGVGGWLFGYPYCTR